MEGKGKDYRNCLVMKYKLKINIYSLAAQGWEEEAQCHIPYSEKLPHSLQWKVSNINKIGSGVRVKAGQE